MRRIEALVGPDALKHVNVERRLLDELASVLGSGDVDGLPDRARRAMQRIKQLESELGRIRKTDRGSVVESLARGAQRVDGVALVVSTVPGEDASGLRELAQALRERLEREGEGAAVLATKDGTGAKLVATSTNGLVRRGITAPALLEPAATAVGGRAGGKPILAMGGGSKAEALDGALGAIPARLAELLATSTGGTG
jgi:alanyl-tRNA synthetase